VRLRFVSCRGVIAIEIEGKDAGRYSLRALCRLLGRTHVDDCDDAGLLRASLADIEVFLGAGSGRLIRI
jgi:hypothetical protein